MHLHRLFLERIEDPCCMHERNNVTVTILQYRYTKRSVERTTVRLFICVHEEDLLCTPTQPTSRDRTEMRATVVLVLLALCLLRESQSVWVTEGDLRFPLEAVKVLKNLLHANAMSTALPPSDGSPAVCSNPNLPAEFLPVCEKEGASVLFTRLVDIITPPDPCEICANVACTGCL
ncbi:hypothetical protein SKAU_G00169880 [Synaphobranchus kaupii]|uniref:Guanylate cyclase activator 2B n=1 Tax=Synaphobranchus kaupii TaxID=118154 RepID=A0A9Q1FKF6_SYNKA|nr:hypothetical protein SKAU_G00169880 [Synaphobranchus kaupii]